MIRIGFGYDVHRLVAGRKLILGGVEIPYELGLSGHSDADVLVHAIGDALLGALALGDLGQHFPPDDVRYKNISSLVLLRRIAGLIEGDSWIIGNVDTVIIAQKPKLSPYYADMQERIADTLQVRRERVSIKATTSEGIGFTGRGEGIAAYALTTLTRKE